MARRTAILIEDFFEEIALPYDFMTRFVMYSFAQLHTSITGPSNQSSILIENPRRPVFGDLGR